MFCEDAEGTIAETEARMVDCDIDSDNDTSDLC